MSLLVLQMDRNCTRINQPLCTFLTQKTLTHLTSKENSLKRLNIFKIKLLGYVFKNSSMLFFLAQLSIYPGAVLQGSLQRHSSACHVDYQHQQIEQHFHDQPSLSYIHPSKHHLVGKASCASKQMRKNMIVYVMLSQLLLISFVHFTAFSRDRMSQLIC